MKEREYRVLSFFIFINKLIKIMIKIDLLSINVSKIHSLTK